VYRVTAIYVIVAAGALQLVDSIVPSTRLPDWSDELFLALVLLGLPIAIVLAWAFEVGPGGVRRTRPEAEGAGVREGPGGTAVTQSGRGPAGTPKPAPPPRHQSPAEHPASAAAGAGAPAEADVARAELDIRHLAVLPFEVLSGTGEAEPLASGLHDDLLTELSRVPGLTVISRTSVRGYRNTDKPVRQIARELGVGTLVECGVQSAAGRVRLNVQLIDARNDAHRWAETFDRQLSAENIFDIQTELARRIAGSLRAELTAEEEERLVGRATTDDLDAYRLCALGRERLDRRTEAEMRRAADMFRQAIERDPRYALAWVGLSDALGLLVSYGHDELAHGLPRAEEAVQRALELAPDSAEAHASLGLLHYLRHRGPETLRTIERAIELRPGYAEAHNWLAYVRLLVGRPEEAPAAAERSVELDPLSAEAASNLSLSLLAVGQPERALGEARRTRELEPAWTHGAFCEGLACHALGRVEDAIALLRELVVPWADPGPRVTLALTYAASGDTGAARDIRESLERTGEAFGAGLIHAALDAPDAAFEAFERVDDWSDWPSLAVHGLYPEVWSKLRDDPRHAELLRVVDRSWGMDPGDSARQEGN